MKGIRLIGIVAAVLLLLAIGSGIAFAEQDEPDNANLALSEAPDAEPGTEIAADRTANSETFRLPNGERETRVYAEPVNYEDSGEWQPIGSALRESSDGAALTNGSNDFDVELPQQLDSNPARISFGDKWISSQLLGANTEAVELEGKTASYESSQGNVAFTYSGLANGLKEDIELGNASQPSSFTFLLDASAGLTPSLNEAGEVEFQDEVGQPVATLPAPLMYDSAPEHPATSSEIHYELEPAEGSWRLKVVADRAWLEQPERVWPVHLDPSTVKLSPKLTPNFDCAFGGRKGSKNADTCGKKGVQELSVAYWPKSNSAEDEWSRAMYYFELNSFTELPKGAYIKEATLSMRAKEAALNTSGVELGLVKRKLKYDQLNWTEYIGGKLWTNEGGDYSEVVGKVTTAERGPAAGWWNFPLAVKPVMEFAETKGAAEGEPGEPRRIALLAKLIDDKSRECAGGTCTQRQIKFESSAATNPENRPYLSVKYFTAAPATAKLASPLDGTQSAKRFRLKARWESGITGVSFQYRKGNKGRFEDLPAEFVKDAEGKPVSAWPLAVSGTEETKNFYLDATALEPKYKAEEGKLQLRALFYGGVGVDGYSTPSNVIVNPDLGGAADTEESVGPGSVDLLTGNFTVSRGDFTLPDPFGSVDVSRTYSSRNTGATGDTGVLGRGWQPTSMVESANGADWRSIVEFPPSAEEAEEGFGGYVHLTDLHGTVYTFEKEGESYVSPPELAGWQLTHATGTFTLADTSGNKTVFSYGSGGTEYLPVSISQTGSGDTSAKYVYELVGSGRRLKTLVGAGGTTSCGEGSAGLIGCHALEFTYKPATNWGAPAADGERLASITYWGPETATKQGHWEVAKYEYDSDGRLIAEWDPRLATPLKETYTYVGEGSTESAGQIRTLTPPGLEPWTFEYKALAGEKAEAGRLSTVKRASLVSSPSTAQTTIAYGVPLSGGSAPNQMSLADISKWGQEDLPLDATAIFGPDEVPSSPPSSYAKATVFYMDSEGQTVNTARTAGAGMSGPSISTTETDEFGNVVRELSPQNRLRALEAGAGSAAKSREIDSKFKYSKDGTELQEEFGPLHLTRIAETGETKPARMHTIYGYDKGWPKTGVDPHVVTNVTTGASIVGKGIDADQRVTETKYDWTLLRPIETIVDPGGLSLKTVVVYDKETGQVIERRTPGGEKAGDAHTTKISYYRAGGCGNAEKGWVGLPCEVGPAGQPGTAGLPELLVTKYKAYNSLGEPTEVVESPGGKEEAGKTRKTITTYDAVGREVSTRHVGGGTELPPTATVYSTETGLPVEQKFTEGSDNQASVTEFNKLGRPIKYTDADGNTSITTYDLDGRVATKSDTKGSQAYGYDPISGALTTLVDSSAGTFTAAYDADGNMTEEGLPDGIVAKVSYDETDQPTALSYTKTGCAPKCTFEESQGHSIYGQVLSDESSQGSRQYGYDNAGRLKLATETPLGGACTTRTYEYDNDSNRKTLETRASGTSVCDTKSVVTPQKYEYDAGDRLNAGSEVVYDPFGRITSLAGKYAGGGTLTTSFFSNSMVASQSQSGVTNTYELDALGRQRQRIQTGGVKGTEIFHYDGPSDSVAWTEREGAWTRNIAGIGGGLIGIQNSAETTLQLTNLHGDIIARAGTSKEITGFTTTFQYDEFGYPKQSEPPRFGWLGGEGRRTELASGVIQMGVRSYVPTLGRFLSPDPVEGGSANAYDYSNADPVNGFDIAGTKPYEHVAGGGACEAGVHVWSPKAPPGVNGRGGVGRFYARIYLRCGSFHGVNNFIVDYVGWRLEQTPGSGDIVREHELHVRGEDTGKGIAYNNWNRGNPFSFNCLYGIEYQFILYIDVHSGMYPVEEYELAAQEVCGHGGY